MRWTRSSIGRKQNGEWRAYEPRRASSGNGRGRALLYQLLRCFSQREPGADGARGAAVRTVAGGRRAVREQAGPHAGGSAGRVVSDRVVVCAVGVCAGGGLLGEESLLLRLAGAEHRAAVC